MVAQRKFSIPELLDLADRMISRGTSNNPKYSAQLQQDCLSCGLLLSHMLLKEVISEAIILGGNDDTPPTVPK